MLHSATVFLMMILLNDAFFLFIPGCVVGQSNFHRKPGRTQNKGRTTVKPAPVAIDTSDDETSDQCPEPTGFFADAEQCDKYYACNDGVISERLCPDGMVFNDYSIDQEKCDLPYNIDCSKRPKLRK